MPRPKPSTPAGELLAQWKLAQWPPPFRQVAGLPIYVGHDASVRAWAEPLSAMLAAISDRLTDYGSGRLPRWMAIPKVLMHVERLNLAEAPAKASKRFEAVAPLLRQCGALPPEAIGRLDAWVAANPGRSLVAHKPFADLRAYAWVRGERRARRVRFYTAGLVVAPPPDADLQVQDHRGTVRVHRRDAYAEPLATTAAGWAIFGDPRRAG